MDVDSAKGALSRYLDAAHEALLWKLDGLSEYDLRRPLTPTGTNLLGLVKHVAWVESEYFGEVFGRPHDLGEAPPHEVPNSDLHATADETSEEIIDLSRRSWDVLATDRARSAGGVRAIVGRPCGFAHVGYRRRLGGVIGEPAQHAGTFEQRVEFGRTRLDVAGEHHAPCGVEER